MKDAKRKSENDESTTLWVLVGAKKKCDIVAKTVFGLILLVAFSVYAQLNLPGLTPGTQQTQSLPQIPIKAQPSEVQTKPLPPETLVTKQPKTVGVLYPQEGPLDPSEYILGPGDRLRLCIWGGVSVDEELIVSPTGEILIPEYGSIAVGGASLKSAKELVSKAISSVYKGVHFDLSLVGMRVFRVSITGEVKNPGLYELHPFERLSDILLLGTPKDDADLGNIKIFTGSETTTVNIYDFLYRGNKKSNPRLSDGAVVFVPPVELGNAKVYLLTPTIPKGYYPLRGSRKLVDFIQELGGFARGINPTAVRVFRGEEKKLLDLTKSDADFMLSDGDTVLLTTISDSVYVSGEVNKPGGFAFLPGLSAEEYIAMAGGPTSLGSDKRIKLIRQGKEYPIDEIEYICAGDVIYVGKSYYAIFKDFLGTTSGVLSIILTAYALGIFH